MSTRKQGSLRRRAKQLWPVTLLFLAMLACRSTPDAADQTPTPAPLMPTVDEPVLKALDVEVLHVPGGKVEGAAVLTGTAGMRPLHEGDGVEVHSQGQALVQFADWWQLYIYARTVLSLGGLASDPEAARAELQINPDAPPIVALILAAGTIWVEEELPGQVKVETAGSRVTITGLSTKFLVHYNPETQAVWVVASDGDLRVTAGGQTIMVPSRFQTAVFGTGFPLPPVPASRPLLRGIFPLVDVLTDNKKLDSGVLTGQRCRTNAPAEIRSVPDRQSPASFTLPTGAEFALSFDVVDTPDWLLGIDPAHAMWGYIERERLDCFYTIQSLASFQEFNDWFSRQSQVDAKAQDTWSALLVGQQPPAAVPVTPLPPVVVSGASIVTNAGKYEYVCPTSVPIEGVIEATGAGQVTYVWEYEDGSQSDQGTVTFNGEGKQYVTLPRTFNRAIDGAVTLHVLAPQEAYSEKAAFSLACLLPLVAVSGASIVTNAEKYEGVCPTSVPIEGVIEATGAGQVTYVWEYEDGSQSDQGTVTFNGEGKQYVTLPRTFNRAIDGTVTLHVLAPQEAYSEKAGFSLACLLPPVVVSGASIVTNAGKYEYVCPTSVPIEGVIEATGAGQVTYVWEYEDGSQSDQGTVTFNGEGKQYVTLPRTFNRALDGTVTLHVLAPQEAYSEKAGFSLACLLPPVVVSGASIVTNAGKYEYVCPTRVPIEGVIEATGAGVVTYAWEYEDGSQSEQGTVTFNGEGKQYVTLPRTFNRASDNAVTLHVLAPQEAYSEKAAFSLACLLPPVVVSGASIVTNAGKYEYVCPTSVPIEGVIEATGAGQVTYVWEYEDGSQSDRGTVTFNGEGKQYVTLPRTFNRAIDGAVTLHVLAPQEAYSEKAAFSLACQAPVTDYSGDWSVNRGKMSIKQYGDVVEGTFSSQDSRFEFTFKGTVTGDRLKASLESVDRQNPFVFLLELTSDGKTVDGLMSLTSAVRVCGARSGTEFAPGCSFAGDWLTRGEDANETCPMQLTRVDDTVSGVVSCSSAQPMSIAGTLSHISGAEVLDAYFHRGSATYTKPLVYLSADHTQFQGVIREKFTGWCGWRPGSSPPTPCRRDQ